VGRYTVTLTVPKPQAGTVQGMVAEWHPDVPERLTDAELAQYRAGHNAALAELGARTLAVEL
jgi:hypothetical protein